MSAPHATLTIAFLDSSSCRNCFNSTPRPKRLVLRTTRRVYYEIKSGLVPFPLLPHGHSPGRPSSYFSPAWKTISPGFAAIKSRARLSPPSPSTTILNDNTVPLPRDADRSSSIINYRGGGEANDRRKSDGVIKKEGRGAMAFCHRWRDCDKAACPKITSVRSKATSHIPFLPQLPPTRADLHFLCSLQTMAALHTDRLLQMLQVRGEIFSLPTKNIRCFISSHLGWEISPVSLLFFALYSFN